MCPKDKDEKVIEGPEKPQAQLFEMIRNSDDSGISGTGVVAEGCVFSTGKCVVQWTGATPCLQVWESFDAFKKIHIDSHPDNDTELVWYGRKKKN